MQAPPTTPRARLRRQKRQRPSKGPGTAQCLNKAPGTTTAFSASEMSLETTGFAATGGETLLIACGAIARELVALRQQLGAERFAITCLPAIWHNHPQRIPAAVRAKIEAHQRQYRRIFVAYADCGTGGALDAVLQDYPGVERLPGAHCYSFFTGEAAFDALAAEELGTFYLTDYLARHWERLVWQGLGLDRAPELREVIFGHYRRLVYLEQLADARIEASARAAAKRLGLAYQKVTTGLEPLAQALPR